MNVIFVNYLKNEITNEIKIHTCYKNKKINVIDLITSEK